MNAVKAGVPRACGGNLRGVAMSTSGTISDRLDRIFINTLRTSLEGQRVPSTLNEALDPLEAALRSLGTMVLKNGSISDLRGTVAATRLAWRNGTRWGDKHLQQDQPERLRRMRLHVVAGAEFVEIVLCACGWCFGIGVRRGSGTTR